MRIRPIPPDELAPQLREVHDGHHPAFHTDTDALEVRGDVDHPTDQGRINGVVVGVETDVVIATALLRCSISGRVELDPPPTCSDHRREFVERSSTGKTILLCFDAEFVEAAPQVLDERLTFDDRRRGAVGLRASAATVLSTGRGRTRSCCSHTWSCCAAPAAGAGFEPATFGL